MHFLIRQICFELQDGSLIIRSLPTSPFMKPLQAKENVTSLNADVAGRGFRGGGGGGEASLGVLSRFERKS